MSTVEPSREITAHVNSNPADASLAREDGRWVLTMSRVFPQPPQRVWSMLTEPEQLRRWSPVVPDRPLDRPGAATSRENETDEPSDAEVLTCRPPQELVHRWGDNLLRWTLTGTDGGTLLQLQQVFDDRSIATMSAAGWHVCLGGLAATLDGEDVERPTGPRARAYGWAELNCDYTKLFADL